MDIGLPEILIILLVVVLLFGSTRLPKLTRTVGESLKELRDGFTGKETPPVAKKTSKKGENKT